MSGLRIRDATLADVAAVRALLIETWHATYDGTLGAEKVREITDRWHAEAVLAAQVDEGNAAFLVAEREGKLVATASAALGCDRSIDLRRLYVHPSDQGRGVGKELFASCLARFPACQSVRLEVEPRNAAAIAFYRRLGFIEKERGGACGGDEQAAIEHLVMERTLGGP
ncbi:MAG TPA: GNAT family N-acetyltransferase [Beijerinckiaceae bacterium]|nr:GNAT family N-acetyltransferase [Beijerinckiaceae bacterium]